MTIMKLSKTEDLTKTQLVQNKRKLIFEEVKSIALV